jgi:hypothetical protein
VMVDGVYGVFAAAGSVVTASGFFRFARPPFLMGFLETASVRALGSSP